MDEAQATLHEGGRQARRDERRRALVLAAYQLIAEKGFEHLRTRDVAARAGVNIATLHYYFPNKEDLIPEVVKHLLHEFQSMPITDGLAPLDQIHVMFLTLHNHFQTRPEIFIVLSELVLRSLRDAALQPALRQLDDEWHRYLQYLLQEGIREGSFRADLDAAEMATKLIILLKGFFFHQITSPGSITFSQLHDDIDRFLLP